MTFEPSQIELKLPRMSTLEKCYLLESSLIKFGLDGRTNLLHLSGGEKRKLSLASEVKYSLISRRIKSVNHFFLLLPQLLTKPRILFCDEPTSGLDSFSAFAMMNTLRELAGYVNEPRLFQKPPKQSRIVLFSIHQPTSDIFHLFTNVILMNAGRIIFHGTVQEAETLFNSIRLPCPPRYNPAEFYVNRISNPNVADDIVKYVGDAKTFDNSLNSSNNSSESREDDKAASGSKVSWMRQVVLLSHRATLNFLHYPKHYLIELLILFVSCIDFFFLASFNWNFLFTDFRLNHHRCVLRRLLRLALRRSRHKRLSFDSRHRSSLLVRLRRLYSVLRSAAVAEEGNGQSIVFALCLLCFNCAADGKWTRILVVQIMQVESRFRFHE